MLVRFMALRARAFSPARTRIRYSLSRWLYFWLQDQLTDLVRLKIRDLLTA